MTNAELIKAVRQHYEVGVPCTECPYYGVFERSGTCVYHLMIDAADALEADEQRIDGLQKLVDINTERCEALRKQLRESHENYEKHLNELEAQLPKEGEWLRTDAFPHRIYCSVCYKTYVPNDRWQIWVDDELPKNYCPNCGAKMRGENDETDN